MDEFISSDSIVDAVQFFLENNKENEEAENLLIDLACYILDISSDEFLEMI